MLIVWKEGAQPRRIRFLSLTTCHHLALLAGKTPLIPQFDTPFCKTGTTSAKAMVTAVPPMPSMKSPKVVL